MQNFMSHLLSALLSFTMGLSPTSGLVWETGHDLMHSPRTAHPLHLLGVEWRGTQQHTHHCDQLYCTQCLCHCDGTWLLPVPCRECIGCGHPAKRSIGWLVTAFHSCTSHTHTHTHTHTHARTHTHTHPSSPCSNFIHP